MTDRFAPFLPTPPLGDTWTDCEQCGRWPAITVVVRSIGSDVVYRKIETSPPTPLCKACGVAALHHGQQVAGFRDVTLRLFAPYVVARNQKWLAQLKRIPDPRPNPQGVSVMESTTASPAIATAPESTPALLMRNTLPQWRGALLQRTLPPLQTALPALKRTLSLLRSGAPVLQQKALPLMKRPLVLLRTARPILQARARSLFAEKSTASPVVEVAAFSAQDGAASSEEVTAPPEAPKSDDLLTGFVDDINDRLNEGARLAGTPIPRGFVAYEALGDYGGGLSPSEREAFSIWAAWVISRSGYVAMEVPAAAQIEIVVYRLENGGISAVSEYEGRRAATAFPHLLRLSKDVDRIVSSKIGVVPASRGTQIQSVSTFRPERPLVEFDAGRGMWVCTTHRDPACRMCPGAYDVLVEHNHRRRDKSHAPLQSTGRIEPQLQIRTLRRSQRLHHT
jgi:hypothetical protein